MTPPVAESTHEDLAARTVRGDRAAFGELYDRLAPDVHRFLVGLRLGLDHHRVEDAVQETFLRLHRLLPGFEAGRRVRPYVLGVARNVALELARSARPMRPLDAEAGPSREGEAHDAVLRAERDALLARALETLSAEHRTLVVLRFVSELTMQELSHALGCSVPTARSRLREATERLLGELAGAGLAPEVGS